MLEPIASRGDRLETLRALRDRLAAEIDARPPAPAVAALARQLTLILDAIAADAPEEVSFLDELERRRADRESTASAS